MHHHHEAPVAGQSQVYDDRKMGNQAADSGTVDSVHAAFNNGNTLNNLDIAVPLIKPIHHHLVGGFKDFTSATEIHMVLIHFKPTQ